MKTFWNNIAVTRIVSALYVIPSNCVTRCKNLPFYRLLINDSTADKLLHFADGTTVRTRPYEVRWIPKGTEYRIERLATGSCWGICFELQEDPGEPFFNMHLRDHEPVLKLFQEAAKAADERRHGGQLCDFTIRKCLYNIIDLLIKEQRSDSILSRKDLLIEPAVQQIHKKFTENGSLTINGLAKACNISENYLRILFKERFSMGPKEYILLLRIERAKNLLHQGCSIHEVAHMCGYTEHCHFSREFTKHVGISPRSFQALTRHE